MREDKVLSVESVESVESAASLNANIWCSGQHLDTQCTPGPCCGHLAGARQRSATSCSPPRARSRHVCAGNTWPRADTCPPPVVTLATRSATAACPAPHQPPPRGVSARVQLWRGAGRSVAGDTTERGASSSGESAPWHWVGRFSQP